MSSSLELYLGQWVSRALSHLLTACFVSRGLGEGVLAARTVEITMEKLCLVVCVFLIDFLQVVVQSAVKMLWLWQGYLKWSLSLQWIDPITATM